MSLKRAAFLAVALLVTANFMFGNVALAKKIQITDKEVESIKNSLDIFRIFTNVAVTDDKLKAILNMTIKGGKTSTDITYGLFVLSAMNEMEFIDMVVSQRYKTEARAYFNGIIDDRTNLLSYWKDVGFDLPRILSGNITGSMSALTLNTFNTTNDIISIFVAFDVLKKEKTYDGMWFYFDQRRNHTSHLEAWSDAKDAMGFAIQPSLFSRTLDKNKESQLELQFAALWDKWGPYVTPYGLAETAKEQVKNELTDTLVSAIESQQFAEKKTEPTFADKVKLSWNNLMGQLENLASFIENVGQQVQTAAQTALDQIKSAISKLNPFSPAGMVYTSPSATEQGVAEDVAGDETIQKEAADIESQAVQPEEKMTLEEMQETIDDIAERIDVINQEVVKLLEKENKLDAQEIEEPKEKTEEEEQDKPATTTQKAIALCAKAGSATRNKVIFNEIAWMGSNSSANNEWIELKNISGAPIDLAGWQILDKDNQIKIILSENYTGATRAISAGGFWLLERTSDDSAPDAAADFIYTGALNNSNEALYLFNENCILIDEVIASPDWPAGENAAKRTMERKFDLTWQTGANPGGTPKRENSSGYIEVVSSGGGGGGGSSSSPSSQSTTTEATLCSASNTSPTYSPIIFNEIAWMGSASSSADEWIELKNISTSTISLSNWQLIGRNTQNNENNIEVFLPDQNLSAGSFFLLERTNDDSAPGVQADAIFTGSINDSDFVLRLFDQNCALVDEITATSTWQAGQKTPERKTMERKNDLIWYTSLATSSINGLFGTPKAENSQTEENPAPENQPPTAIFTFTPENPILYQEIIFDASSSTDSDGNITSYIWDFGDSAISTTTEATTTHTYSALADFLIVLQVVDDKGATSSPATATITIIQPETPSLRVVINEIAWMGTSATNSSDEWIELYNNTSAEIDLNSWTLSWSHGTTTHSIIFSSSTGAVITTIPAHEFYLIERSDDDQAVDIPADWKGSFGYGLSNDGEKLELRDASNNLIDLVDFSSEWPAGTTSPGYISMERINSSATGTDSANWANNNLITRNGTGAGGNNINGTPKSQNSVSKTETQISGLPFDEFSEITLTELGNPYVIYSLEIPENHTLKIEPGVTLKFRELQYYGGGDSLIVRGTLIAEGTIEKEIVFTSFLTPGGSANWWSRIYFTSSSQNSTLKHSQIRYGGKKQTDTYAIIIDSTSVDIKNSVLENFNESGLKMINSSSTIENLTIQNTNAGEAMVIIGGSPTIENSTFKNTYSGVFIREGSTALFDTNNFEDIDYVSGPVVVIDSYPIFRNNTASNNALNGIYLSGAINQNWTMTKDLPYLIANLKVAENIILTIEPEVIIKFLKDGKLEIYGTLKAEGNSNVFTSLLDDEFGGDTNNDADSSVPYPGGLWDQIFFAPSSQNSILQNSLISYGGRIGQGAIYVKESRVELKNNIFRTNGPGYYTLYMENSPNSIVENSVFENCNVAISIIEACPQMQTLSFNNCNYTYSRGFGATSIISTSTESSSVCSP